MILSPSSVLSHFYLFLSFSIILTLGNQLRKTSSGLAWPCEGPTQAQPTEELIKLHILSRRLTFGCGEIDDNVLKKLHVGESA